MDSEKKRAVFIALLFITLGLFTFVYVSNPETDWHTEKGHIGK